MNREEIFIAAICGEQYDLPEPQVRTEVLLKNILDGEVATLTPVTRIEEYLCAISGQEIELPQPLTRIEQYLAKIAGMDISVPAPLTTLEVWLLEWVGAYSGELVTIDFLPIISVDDALDRPAEELSVKLEPIQDLHGYDSPWPAGGGANQFDEVWESGSFNGNDGTPVVNAAWSRSVNYISVEPETSYYCNFEGVGDANGYYLFFYRADNSFISLTNKSENSIVTTPADSAKCKIQYKRTIETVGNYKVAVNLPSTVTTYSPYSNICPITGRTGVTVDHSGADTSDPQTYPVVFPDGQTVYGGTVDVVSGVLTVTHAKRPISTEWAWTKSTSYPGGFYYTMASLGYKLNTPFICTHARSVSSISDYVGGTCFCDGSLNFRLMPTDGSASVDDWKSYIDAQSLAGNPIDICYELATPQTYQLTPQQIQLLKGSNVLWSDGGDVRLAYWKQKD